MFPCDRRHLRSRHQALRGDLRLIRGRTIATPSRPRNHLKPTDAARLRDVQLDVHFAVCNHTATSLIRDQLCTRLSCFARGDQLSAYVATAPARVLREGKARLPAARVANPSPVFLGIASPS